MEAFGENNKEKRCSNKMRNDKRREGLVFLRGIVSRAKPYQVKRGA
jgi:hypothetical protein